MSNPPPPVCVPGAPCPHTGVINKLVARGEDSNEWRQDLKADIREIKDAMLEIRDIKADQVHAKIAIERAFVEIGNLKNHKGEMEKFIAKVDGMTSLAWALWTILASGLGVALFKLF
jgi:hypothetical protein